MTTPFALFESYDGGRSFHFAKCLEAISVTTHEQILPALRRVERAVRGGLHAAGFLSYEAAPAFEPNLCVKGTAEFPLLWFGLFKERREISAGDFFRDGEFELSNWKSGIDRTGYCQATEQIREHIAAGDTYQVNFTFRLRADFHGDDLALYHRLCRNQRAGYCAYINFGRYRLLSTSPELFFSRQNRGLAARPMKGTRPRGRTTAEDRRNAEELQTSAKERAENLMIVDLLRNDMGRISEFGSVQAPKLFEVERYETVLQMTSTIASRLLPQVGLAEILQALFPSGSVTGAPKIRTMKIIAALEDSPRRIYTGCLGFVSPGPEAMFNVAIRTLLIDALSGKAELGVGSGITYDSSAASEYHECLLKAQFLSPSRRDFALLEAFLYDGATGYFLFDRHLARLADSADYFGFQFDASAIRTLLQKSTENLKNGKFKIRLLLNRDGGLQVSHTALPESAPRSSLRVAIAREPVDSRDVFLFHKTTHRAVYETRKALRPDCDDVLLVNEQGELTESSLANLVVRLDGNDYTPPVECGLLAGTFRAELLALGKLSERVLRPEDLHRAEAIFLINSVRKWMPFHLAD